MERLAHVAVQLITISREYGAGGSELGVLLGKELGWPVLDHELVQQLAARLRCEEGEVVAMDEHVPSFLERLMGKTGGFDKDENKTVIAHELTHALADQHYDLDAMQTAAKGDDDRLLALTALIEGEATLTMLGAQMDDWSGEKVAKLPADSLDRTFRILGPFLNLAGGASMRKAPPIVAETMRDLRRCRQN